MPRKFHLMVAVLLLMAAAALPTCVATRALRAQTAPPQPPAPAASSHSQVPQWQIDAGGTAKFDVASVKQDTATPGPTTENSNVPLGSDDTYSPTGGLFSATDFPFPVYMAFAYKLTEDEMHAVQSQLPKWANTERYDVQAKAPGDPTKDQYRLMMQALLADRFKLALRRETHQVPVFSLVLDKPGKLGPQLQHHSDSPPCSNPSASFGPGFSATVAVGFPEVCGAIRQMQPSAPGRFRIGARGYPLATFASLMTAGTTGVDRPVEDKTGLIGKFDFVIEFSPHISGPPPAGSIPPDPNGPTFLEALKEQLGLKLVPQTGPVDVLVVDHIEEPTPN